MYPNAPLALTVIEVKHPQSDYLSPGQLAGIKQKLELIAPLQKAEDVAEIQMVMGAPGGSVGTTRNRTIHRFSTRDKRTSISYGTESIVVETTDYKNWTWFCGFISAGISARQAVAPVDGLERVGLRYVDEIRIQSDERTTDWSLWVSTALTAPTFAIPGLELMPLQQQAVVQYATQREDETLTLRYGAVNGPPMVSGSPNLIRHDAPDAGPYFLLDTDSAWTLLPGESVPELELDLVLEIANRLHIPAEGVFEALITDKLREDVFAND